MTSTENIENLRKNIENTVQEVKRNVTSAAAQSQSRTNRTVPPPNPRSYSYQCQTRYAQHPLHTQRNARKASVPSSMPPEELALPFSKVPHRISSFFMIALGAIGTVAFGIASLVQAANYFFPAGPSSSSIFPLIFFILSIGLFAAGTRTRMRLNRYYCYLKQIGNATFCPVKMLAGSVHKSERFVLRELQFLVKRGFFPHGKFDQQNTTLILDDKTYQQYQELQKRIEVAQQAAARRSEQLHANPELKVAIEHGEAVIHAIKEANDAIPGETISQKLERLETVTSKIFRYVESHPQKLSEIRKFMDYYLPTTLKLVKAYREFDAQPIQGENILNSKKEIEETLDTINQAFENMFDDLFLSDAVDISADISVLETMLRQEGLTGNEFHKPK